MRANTSPFDLRHCRALLPSCGAVDACRDGLLRISRHCEGLNLCSALDAVEPPGNRKTT